MNSRYLIALILVIALAAFLVNQFLAPEAGPEPEEPEPEPPEETIDLSSEINSLKKIRSELETLSNSQPDFYESGKTFEFELFVSNQGFEPKYFEAGFGDKIVFKALALDADHSIVIPKLQIYAELEQGKETRLEGLPIEKGTYEIYCTSCETYYSELAAIEVT